MTCFKPAKAEVVSIQHVWKKGLLGETLADSMVLILNVEMKQLTWLKLRLCLQNTCRKLGETLANTIEKRTSALSFPIVPF